jgi:hypothetical protein
VIDGFTLSPAAIAPGGGTSRVVLLHDNSPIFDNAPLNSQVQDCPASYRFCWLEAAC